MTAWKARTCRSSGTQPGTHPEIDEYLADVAARLPGSPASNRDLLDELEHGLHESLRRHRTRGVPACVAADAAIAEFGPADVVASANAPEVRIRRMQASAWGALGLLLVTGLGWSIYHRMVGDLRFTLPDGDLAQQAFLALTVPLPVLPVIAQLSSLAVALLCAGAAPSRRTGNRLVCALALVLAVSAVFTVLHLLTLTALLPGHLPWTHRWLLPLATLTAFAGASACGIRAATHSFRLARAARPAP